MKEKNEAGGLHRVIDRINSSAWAILPAKLDSICELVRAKLSGENVPLAASERDEEETSYLQINPDGIAVLQVFGTIGLRMNMFERASGGVSTEILQRDIERASESPLVRGLLLHIDSPGGTVAGTMDLAETIARFGTKKPVVAYTDGNMTSAAYWIASPSKSIVAYPTAQVGSIGVVAQHVDYSRLDEQWGIKRTYIYNGKYKRLANDAEPLSQEGREYIQDMVDKVYGLFVDDVARNRKLEPEHIIGHESKVFLAKEAKEEKLIDMIGSFNQAYNALRKEAGIMTRDELKSQFGELHQSMLDAGIKEATPEAIAEAHPQAVEGWRREGAAAERTRIVAIRSAAFDGQEALVSDLIEKGTASADAILALNQDEKTKRVGELRKIKDDAPKDVGANPAEQAAAAGPKSAGDQLDRLAKEKAEKEKIPYNQALLKVQNENPELAAEVAAELSASRGKG